MNITLDMLAEASFGLRIYGVNSDCNISGFVFVFKKSPTKWKKCQLNPWMQWVPSFCIHSISIKDRRRLYWISGSVRYPPLFSWNNNKFVANKCMPLQGIMAILNYTVWMVGAIFNCCTAAWRSGGSRVRDFCSVHTPIIKNNVLVRFA